MKLILLILVLPGILVSGAGCILFNKSNTLLNTKYLHGNFSVDQETKKIELLTRDVYVAHGKKYERFKVEVKKWYYQIGSGYPLFPLEISDEQFGNDIVYTRPLVTSSDFDPRWAYLIRINDDVFDIIITGSKENREVDRRILNSVIRNVLQSIRAHLSGEIILPLQYIKEDD